jgi:predicted RNA binding protein YcfA (HicA-like mRNA interferase family)
LTPYLPIYIIRAMDSRTVVKKLRADGWRLESVRGSHHQFKHPTKAGRVSVPHPKRDLAPGTVKSIERQSGVKLR